MFARAFTVFNVAQSMAMSPNQVIGKVQIRNAKEAVWEIVSVD
jgi:hypothetical protein